MLVSFSRCKEWIINLHQPDLERFTSEKLHGSYRVCSDHFEPDQFMNPQRKRLVHTAVPTLCSPPEAPMRLQARPGKFAYKDIKPKAKPEKNDSKVKAKPRVQSKNDSMTTVKQKRSQKDSKAKARPGRRSRKVNSSPRKPNRKAKGRPRKQLNRKANSQRKTCARKSTSSQ